ncbi:outer membrane protein [Polycladidibacter hongkongensis]|uniref:outer membrane protein n=1 Tax=Polycladidibacter hongkongensis TaxID=1647556 RepID=UPI00082AE54D|nr:outer membrane beta-barrel protein [Pseudovibrio hongkongensis]
MKLVIFAACIMAFSPIVVVNAEENPNWSGVYLGIKGDYDKFTYGGSIGNGGRSSDLSLGVSLYGGVNTVVLSKLLLGAEVLVGTGATEAYGGEISSYTVGWRFEKKRELEVEGRVRFGFAFDRFLPFASAGVGYERLKLAFEHDDVARKRRVRHSTRANKVFFSAGTGVDLKIYKGLTFRGEYNYRRNFGEKTRFLNQYLTDPNTAHRFSTGLHYQF